MSSERPENSIFYGRCQCGCGQKTKIASKDRADRGWIKGEPLPFISGHKGLLTAQKPKPEIAAGLCQCGCGQRTQVAKVTRADRYQIKGEPLRFVWGHQTRKHMPAPEGMKRCYTCGVSQPMANFYKSYNIGDGLQSHCIPCSKANQNRWRANNPGGIQRLVKLSRIRKQFGLSSAEYDALVAAQGGLCALCGRPERKRRNKDGSLVALALDHCHETGRIRALLCNGCNSGLGLFLHDPALLQKAIEYLKTYGH